MKDFINSLEGLPLLVKLILALPALDIVWGIYRILSALDAKNTVATPPERLPEKRQPLMRTGAPLEYTAAVQSASVHLVSRPSP